MRELGLLYSRKYSSRTRSLITRDSGSGSPAFLLVERCQTDELNMVSSKKKKLFKMHQRS